jgi:polyphosphate glucokinase
VLAGLDELRKLLPAFRPRLGRLSRRRQARRHLSAANLHPCGPRASRCKRAGKALEEAGARGNDADVAGYGAIRARASSWCSRWAPAWARRCSPTATSAPAWSWPTTLAQEGHDLRGLPGPPRPRQVRQGALERLPAAAIKQTAALFNWDHLYLGGGNTKKILFTPAGM